MQKELADLRFGNFVGTTHKWKIDRPGSVIAGRSIRPSLCKWRLIDRYVMSPLRFVIPQRGELGETVAAIVSGETTTSIDQGGASEEPQIIRYRILRPVFSCALFIVVMLTLGCVYFATRDFKGGGQDPVLA